jgi:tetratricopeptide (TPR) repeat protein
VADRPKKSPPSASSGGSLYERYKDALRRGHVSALRRRYEAAIGAYSEAAAIAPDRALPHQAIGGILVKMGRPGDAMESYGRALALAPRDEAALRGQADLLAAAGRRAEAAMLLDRLADVLDGSGRLADASDAARRALELAESRERRRQVEAYADRLRASPGDEAAARALAQVLRVLEPPVVAETVVTETVLPEVVAAVEPGSHQEPAAGAAVQPEPEPEPEAEALPAPEPIVAEELGPAAAAADAAPIAEPEIPAAVEPAAEPEPEPEPELPDGFILSRAAEAALARGDDSTARDGLLAAAAAHRRAGRSFAAIDACYLALAVAPADVDLHVMLTELYLERGWRGPAVDKLLLLGRLADLSADTATRERLCAIATDGLPDEPRLAELCA